MRLVGAEVIIAVSYQSETKRLYMAMRVEEWQKIEGLLDAVLELTPAERRKFLDEASANEPELRRKVESLLSCEEEVDGFLAAPVFVFAADFLTTQIR